MPADFERCVDKGGKVITKSLPNDKYMRLCKDPDSGKWKEGEKKKKENKENK